MFLQHTAYADDASRTTAPILDQTKTATIDLRSVTWGEGQSFSLDGVWDSYWNEFVSPARINEDDIKPEGFPVPAMWGDRSTEGYIRPAQGYMTYHLQVLVPEHLQNLHMYVPDMPSAYKLWVNENLKAQNGTPGKSPATEQPDFRPHIIHIMNHSGVLDIVIHVSNYHYREGGIWFSLKVTDDSGLFEIEQQPMIAAVFFGAILISIGLMNLALFIFRTKEFAALYFGLLCISVGIRRLLIDERVLYLFDVFSWSTLQRVEHMCFYLTLPLFGGFFAALYKNHVPKWTPKLFWITSSPFLFICLTYPNRVYTELNISYQILVVLGVLWIFILYMGALKGNATKANAFGASLLILGFTVIHDVLKSNGIISTEHNIAHFGVLAFIVSQTIALQRNYLKNLSLVEDMSGQLQSRNDELVQMDKFKDEFLSTTSHELRTPLQGISGLAKVLKEEGETQFTEDQKSKIELISNTTQRLSVLVNDILDFSSIKHGKLKLNISTLDLRATAELVLSTMKPIIGTKDVTLSAQIAPETNFLKADEFRIQQILFNLMGNAAKYTESGAIQLVSYVKNNQVFIEITDSGTGIPDEKLSSLFRPFEQVHVEGHMSASGTGLGLSISRQLVELHGGTLNLSSKVNEGTSVTIALPYTLLATPDIATKNVQKTTRIELVPEENRTLIEKQTSSIRSEQPSDGPLIFVVDDEPVNLEVIASQLNKQSSRVELFSDGIQVLSRLTEVLPDLILLDYIMPRMTGIEVCQLIRKQYDSYELPVMMLTARHQIGDIVNALSAGANDYLVKPYHDQELLARVQTQLSVRQYWIANKENQKLKTEIERREALEEDLSELNARLLNILDFSAELILLVNDDLSIVYANEKATTALQSDQTGLLGQTIVSFVTQNVVTELSRMLVEQPKDAFTMDNLTVFIETEAAQAEKKNISIKCFFEDSKVHLALVVTKLISPTSDDTSASSALANLTAELGESRKKIDQIEGALKQVMIAPSISEPDNQDDRISAHIPQTDAVSDHKEQIVSLLRTSLNLWERYTDKGKVDLAERSRCWRVYVDGTTVKTRTFDKYLSARSVPDRPRWRAVVRTANYVSAQCDLKEEERSQLVQQTKLVENYYN